MNKKLVFNIVALICSLWFALLSWAWVYLFNVLFVFPVAIVGFVFWRMGRGDDYMVMHKITLWLFVFGVVSAVGVILFLR